ncbi:nucleotidyltransferase family protein [Derxia lacustris]|uniref:nucleotidyltransferase family protein n=1 Tax=Derxia lacustris TaxID=764842 RepID=UPI002E26C428
MTAPTPPATPGQPGAAAPATPPATGPERRAASPAQIAELVALVRADATLMRALAAVRALGLPDACIGAGAIRNRVWDRLHGFDQPSSAKADIDVIFFDAAETRVERDHALEHQLKAAVPDLAWEVVNQAGVHLWFEEAFGYAAPPLLSLEDGVASWPEIATCVAVRLAADDGIEVIAPFGLDDLFGLVCRRNAARVRPGTYRARLLTKGWKRRWPRLNIVQG